MGQQSSNGFDAGLSASSRMQYARKLCQLYARIDRPVLFLGPVGAGKTSLARYAHGLSRRQGDFVAVSSGELTENLYADTLFGHLKGAYTGATHASPGVIESARRGTLLLDDLALMPSVVQAAILRVVDTGAYRPLGATDDSMATCRFMFASTVPLDDLIAEGRLITDLASRIGELVVDVPGLAERTDDIIPLAERLAQAFLDEVGRDGSVRFNDQAAALLESYPWPRNVRELGKVIERALIHAGLDLEEILIRPGHLPDRFHEPHESRSDQATLSRGLVEAVLNQVGGNQSEAARRLGVHRNTIARYLRPA